MLINSICVRELENEDLFESEDHISRFSELISCFSDQPFFNAGLCKAMYLGAWDEEHFLILLEILNDMALGRDQDTQAMEDNGKIMESTLDGREREMFKMSGAFLTGEPYEIPDDADRETKYIIDRALRAANIIDEIIDY